MALRYYANAPATTLAASCTAVATSIQVASVTGLPIQYPYTLILARGTSSEEAVEVTNAAGTTLTVTRGIDSTTAFEHSIGDTVVHGITARDIREPNTHIDSEGGVHGVAGDVVGTTDAQALTNKDLSSATNTFPATLATDAEVATAQAAAEATAAAALSAAVTSLEGDLATHEADTSTHGVTGAVVGTTDAQVLTNKDLSSATNTFPTGLVDTLTAWSTYAPTFSGFTQGNGTVSFRYKQIGKTVIVQGKITLGTTSAVTDTIEISLPVAGEAHGGIASWMLGSAIAEDVTEQKTYTGAVIQNQATTFIIRKAQYGGVADYFNGSTPFSWGNSDELYVEFRYEAD